MGTRVVSSDWKNPLWKWIWSRLRQSKPSPHWDRKSLVIWSFKQIDLIKQPVTDRHMIDQVIDYFLWFGSMPEPVFDQTDRASRSSGGGSTPLEIWLYLMVFLIVVVPHSTSVGMSLVNRVKYEQHNINPGKVRGESKFWRSNMLFIECDRNRLNGLIVQDKAPSTSTKIAGTNSMFERQNLDSPRNLDVSGHHFPYFSWLPCIMIFQVFSEHLLFVKKTATQTGENTTLETCDAILHDQTRQFVWGFSHPQWASASSTVGLRTPNDIRLRTACKGFNYWNERYQQWPQNFGDFFLPSTNERTSDQQRLPSGSAIRKRAQPPFLQSP